MRKITLEEAQINYKKCMGASRKKYLKKENNNEQKTM